MSDSESEQPNSPRIYFVIRYVCQTYNAGHNSLIFTANFSELMPAQVPPLRFLNIGGNSIGDDGAAIVSKGLVEAAGLRLLMLRFLGLDNNSMCDTSHCARKLLPRCSTVADAFFFADPSRE